MFLFCFVVLTLCVSLGRCEEDIWQGDLSNDVYIAANVDGFDRTSLVCHENYMNFSIHMSEDFEGIVYTRGSYKEAKAPCFLDADGSTRKLQLSIPFNDCKTKEVDDGIFLNTVIVQHDDLLIFPGDMAFEIKCNSSETLNHIERVARASIGVADPDPSAKELPEHRKSTVFGETEVEFTPKDVRPRVKNRKSKNKDSKKKKKKTTRKTKGIVTPGDRDEL